MKSLRESYVLKFGLALLVIVVLIGAVGFYVQASATSTLEGDVENQLNEETEADAKQLGEWVQSIQSPVLMAADNENLAQEETLQEYVTRINEDQLPEQAAAIHVVDAIDDTQPIIASSDESRVGQEARGSTDWAAQVGGTNVGEVTVSDPEANAAGDTIVVGMTLARQDPSLLVAIEFNADDLSNQFSAGIDGTFTEVVRQTGEGHEVLFSNYPDADRALQPYIEGQKRTPLPDEATATAQFTSSMSVTSDDDVSGSYVGSYATIETSLGADWVVIKHAPEGNAFALSQDIQQGILVFVAIALVGVVLIGGTIGRNTANAVSDLSEKARALEEGDLDVEVESSRKDEIGQLYDTFDTMREALKERIQEVEVARAEAEEEREKAEEQRRQLQDAADRYEDTMEKCADGDLTQRLEPDENNEAMRKIAEEFNYMIDQIEGTVAQVKQFSGKVSDTSTIVLESTSELKDASGQIAESAQVISEETDDVQEDLEAVTAELEDCLGRLGSGDQSAIEDLEQLSDEIGELAERTSEALNESESIAAATEEQTAALSEVTETAKDLDRSAGPLADLLDNFKSSEDQAFHFGEASGVDRSEDDD